MIWRLKSIYYRRRSCGLFCLFCFMEWRIENQVAGGFGLYYKMGFGTCEGRKRVRDESVLEVNRSLLFQLPTPKLISVTFPSVHFLFCSFFFLSFFNYVSIYDDYVLEIYIVSTMKNICVKSRKENTFIVVRQGIQKLDFIRYLYPSHPENSKMRRFK